MQQRVDLGELECAESANDRPAQHAKLVAADGPRSAVERGQRRLPWRTGTARPHAGYLRPHLIVEIVHPVDEVTAMVGLIDQLSVDDREFVIETIHAIFHEPASVVLDGRRHPHAKVRIADRPRWFQIPAALGHFGSLQLRLLNEAAVRTGQP